MWYHFQAGGAEISESYKKHAEKIAQSDNDYMDIDLGVGISQVRKMPLLAELVNSKSVRFLQILRS